MSNIGIFGGTFNPVHKGHRLLIDTVIQAVDFSRIIVLPDRIPPHKSAENLADGADRLEMCKLAFGDVDKVAVSDWELKQRGKSYSVYTLRHFHELYPDDKLFFIMGSDMLLSFHEWFCYEEILSLASIICISRKNADTNNALNDYALDLTHENGEVIVLDVEPFEISSTALREKIADNDDLACYLDANVVQYITEKKLYSKGR